MAVLGFWILAQICLEQICIYPKGVKQDSLTCIPAGTTLPLCFAPWLKILANQEIYLLDASKMRVMKKMRKDLAATTCFLSQYPGIY